MEKGQGDGSRQNPFSLFSRRPHSDSDIPQDIGNLLEFDTSDPDTIRIQYHPAVVAPVQAAWRRFLADTLPSRPECVVLFATLDVHKLLRPRSVAGRDKYKEMRDFFFVDPRNSLVSSICPASIH